MARPRKNQPAAAAARPPKHGNGYDPETVKDYVDRLESLDGDIASIMGKAKSDCRAVHADRRQIFDDAKDEDGIPKKALRKVIIARRLERKAAEAREELEGDDQDSYDMLRHALGDLADTPLGQAASAKAKPGKAAKAKNGRGRQAEDAKAAEPAAGTPPGETDARPGFLQRRQAERDAAEAEKS